jgi:hypothetical protein
LLPVESIANDSELVLPRYTKVPRISIPYRSPAMLTRSLFLAPLLASAALSSVSPAERPIDGDTSIVAHTGEPVGTEQIVDGSQCIRQLSSASAKLS